MPCSVASDLVLHCVPVACLMDAMQSWPDALLLLLCSHSPYDVPPNLSGTYP